MYAVFFTGQDTVISLRCNVRPICRGFVGKSRGAPVAGGGDQSAARAAKTPPCMHEHNGAAALTPLSGTQRDDGVFSGSSCRVIPSDTHHAAPPNIYIYNVYLFLQGGSFDTTRTSASVDSIPDGTHGTMAPFPSKVQRKPAASTAATPKVARAVHLVLVIELDHGVRQSVKMSPQRRMQLQQRRVEGPVDLLQALLRGGVDEKQRGVPQEAGRQHLPTCSTPEKRGLQAYCNWMTITGRWPKRRARKLPSPTKRATQRTVTSDTSDDRM